MNTGHMIILTDILKNPLDEGAKIATLNLLKHIKRIIDVNIISLNSDTRLPFVDEYYTVNKLLFNPILYGLIRKQKEQNLLYIPESSITLLSFIRAKLLQLFTGKSIHILSLQPRQYGVISRIVIKTIGPKSVITQSKNVANSISDLGIVSHILPLGVDDNKYYEVDDSIKIELRNKYKVAQDKKVILHVGHIQQSRNLEWLVSIKKVYPEVEVIMVGSTYNTDDEALYNRLINKGIRVLRDYIYNMEEVYNLADYYIFPVKRLDGAIGTPLSVLEAISCNLPVITTRFGSLPDVFEEDNCFRYVESVNDVVEILNGKRVSNCNNRDRIKLFTWEKVAHQLVEIIH